MIRLGLALSFGMWLLAGRGALGAESPDPKEVYDLLEAHLPGITKGELERAAVKGIIDALAPRAMLLSKENERETQPGALLTRATNFDSIAYLRVGEVSSGLTKAILEGFGQLGEKRAPKGLILDLRFAGGESYDEAAGCADLFLLKERPLINTGGKVIVSKEKNQAITIPVAVLVNRGTKGAAEALAAMLRETGTGLLLGNSTAGQAMIWTDFVLKNGERLRIATGRVQIGKEIKLGPEGVKPDIAVNVPPAEEQLFYADPFRVVSNRLSGALVAGANSASGTNGSRRPRNEAELVRERRDGLAEPEAARARRPESERPLVSDPALGRALDVLKGLAVVNRRS